MSTQTRRTFLKASGVLVGGTAVGTTGAAAGSAKRYLVDSADVGDRTGVEVVHRLDGVDLAVVRGSERAVKGLKASYAPDTEFRRGGPTRGAADASAADGPLYGRQWDKQDQRIPEVHEVTRGEGARVAVIDTGIAVGHPDLTDAVNEGLSKNFTADEFGAAGPYGGYHGTHVAGIVAASDRNDAGVVGSAPGVELVDCRVFSETAPAPTFSAFFGDVLAAIAYSADVGADAANLSLGGYLSRKGLGSFYGKLLNRTTTYATRNGTLLVHAAGNVSTDLQHDGRFVDTSESARGVGVSATGPVGFGWGDPGVEKPPHAPAYYTNYGTNAIDIGAPGGNVSEALSETPASERPEGWRRDQVFNCVARPEYDAGEYLGATYGYDWLLGTSMAAPQVTAAAALVKSANPGYNANRVASTLRRAATVPDGYAKPYYGAGYLDTLEAVRG